MIYRNKNNEEIRFPYNTGEIQIMSAAWLSDKDPTDYGLTGPHEIVEPSFDADTQKLVKLASGEYEVVSLTAQEIEDRKPKVVTMRQARAALILTGNLQLIQPAIDAIEDDTERLLAQNEWDYSSTVERERGLTQLLGSSIFTDEQLDQLFALAAQQA